MAKAKPHKVRWGYHVADGSSAGHRYLGLPTVFTCNTPATTLTPDSTLGTRGRDFGWIWRLLAGLYHLIHFRQ
jgi:hypothetical protein